MASLDEDVCPSCGGLLYWYCRRELEIDDDNSTSIDFVDYQECENCKRDPHECGDYSGVENRY